MVKVCVLLLWSRAVPRFYEYGVVVYKEDKQYAARRYVIPVCHWCSRKEQGHPPLLIGK